MVLAGMVLEREFLLSAIVHLNKIEAKCNI